MPDPQCLCFSMCVCLALKYVYDGEATERPIAGTAWHRIEENVWMPDLHHKAAIRWFFEAASTDQFPIHVMGSLQQFCDSIGKVDTLGLLNFRSPSAMESIGLYPQTEENESEFYSSDSDENDVEIEE